MNLTIEFKDSFKKIDAGSCDALVGGMPLLSHAFFMALEESNSIGEKAGWQPFPLLVFDDEDLVGATPLFIKGHSYGEYVFDWAWAEAYERNGLNYYPKILSAIPFSPVTSQRLLVASVDNASQIQRLMLEELEKVMLDSGLSSAHVLFPNEDSASILKQANWLQRQGVQFKWTNESFQNFEEFLGQLTQQLKGTVDARKAKAYFEGLEGKSLPPFRVNMRVHQLLQEFIIKGGFEL